MYQYNQGNGTLKTIELYKLEIGRGSMILFGLPIFIGRDPLEQRKATTIYNSNKFYQ